MMKTQLGHNFLNWFGGVARLPQVSDHAPVRHGYGLAVIGAFFMVALAALILNGFQDRAWAAQSLNRTDEKAAYQPGRLVTEDLQRGYLSVR